MRYQKNKEFPSGKRNSDNLKLLLSDSLFNERVRDIRTFLHIPIDGFDSESKSCDQECKNWQDELCRRSDEVADSQEFWKELKKHRMMLDNKEISYKEYKSLNYELHDKIPVNYLTRSVERLIDEFNVPANYRHSIHNFILYNKHIWTPMNVFSDMPGTRKNGKEKAVTLTIYAKLTDKDLKYIKEHVNEVVGKDLPDFNPLQDIETKITIEEYYKNRNVFDEVEAKPYKLSSAEIAENVEQDTGKKIKPKDVYENVRSIKNLRDKRFRKNSGKSSP